MNEIQIFNNPEFGEIRTVLIDDEPWFVVNDVANSLGYSRGRNSLKHIDDEDKKVAPIRSPLGGGEQETYITNESGLYSLIFGSKLESAKKFKKWVTSEVLPSIRKHGAYQLPQSTDGKIALLAQGHTELKAEVDEIRSDLEALKMDLPLLPAEAEDVSNAVKRRVVEILGGKSSNAYHNKSISQQAFSDAYRELKRNFNVRSYKCIKRNDAENAVKIAYAYNPPLYLKIRIDEENGVVA